MAKLLRLRRGTDTQHSSFTGAEGEVTVNTTNDSLHVHDGTTAGGRELARADLSNLPAGTIDNADISSSAAIANSKLATSGVTAGTYGSSSAIPAITVNDRGIVTSATTNAIDSTSITNGTSNVSVALNGNTTVTRSSVTRLTVNNTGIDVNGTVTCENLTVDGALTQSDGTGLVTVKDNNSTGNAVLAYIQGTDSADTQKWFVGYGSSGNQDLYVSNQAGGQIQFGSSGTTRVTMQAGGHLVPATTNASDLGTSSLQWRNGYFDGTVTCDGLTSDASVNFNSAANFAASGWSGEACKIQNFGNTLYIQGDSNGVKFRRSNGSDNAEFTSAGHFRPTANNIYDLGDSSNRWRNLYTNDLNLSNEGGTNDVDGTWGSWTIQEGEDDLFLLNRRNGKKYKFNLSEVN